MVKYIFFFAAASILLSSAAVPAQSVARQYTQTVPSRLAFADAQSLLSSDGAPEGNLGKRTDNYSLTRLRDGRVLELFYPMKTSASTRSPRSPKSASLSGYGVLHESEASYRESMRPRHILEDLLPDPPGFVSQVPALISRLEQRMRIGAGRLDYSRSSLRRVDSFVSSYRRSHSTADSDPSFFQQLTAYYGEVLRRETSGEWVVSNENIAQKTIQRVPNVRFERNGVRVEKRPWSTVLNILNNEDNKNPSLAAAWEADLRPGSE